MSTTMRAAVLVLGGLMVISLAGCGNGQPPAGTPSGGASAAKE